MLPLDRIVAEIPRAARENIRVSLREKRGSVGVELRIAAANGRGTMAETAKGLRIPLSRIPDVIAALQNAQRVAQGLSLVAVDRE
ncbi:hypothetical protein [Methylobacterium iners]|uniref:Uncharacterized protein n=1 Tax=Methylobacterium iners TaxID=418707 RepID=A0ABQ4S370_9HYPH|nr:hypothetical protein [Methylobacterium iners]GJD97583.1 hypothetical protein OCOJLMKI_4815 [Methylobacterium iners]